jgi:hypothetical protein
MKNCLMKYDWGASLIRSNFPLLRRFNFYLHVVELGNIDVDSIVRQLVQNFQSHHNATYRSMFFIAGSQMHNLLSFRIHM